MEYTTRGRFATIRESGWKYCFHNWNMEELYNFANDPLELTNLAYHPEHQELKKQMRDKLFKQGFAEISEETIELKW